VAGRIYGRVSTHDIDRIRTFKQLDAVPSVRIGIDLPAGRVTATSDRWGRFQFDDVPPGRYPLSVDAGKGLTPWMSSPVVMPGPQSCVDSSIVLQPAGKLSGRVLTADGRPAAGIYLRVLPDGPAGSPLTQLVTHGKTTGPDGTFSFEGLRPDTYVVAVNPDAGDPTGRQPYGAVWFGGANRAAATRIPLAEGAAVALDRPFVLPPPLPTRTFTVAAACRDGSVPPGLMVRAAAANGARFAEFDTTGRGDVRTLTLVRDQAYTLYVSIFVPAGNSGPGGGPRREEKLAPMELPAGAPGRHIALVAPLTQCAETAR
jgi:hypothetical protein